MENENEFKKIDINSRTCYYFDDIMRAIDIDFHSILLDKKTHKNFLIYKISYKTFMGEKPLYIWFNKMDGFIKIYNGIKYLVLLEYNESYDWLKYLISEKNNITDSINHNLARIRTGLQQSHTSIFLSSLVLISGT